MDTTTQWILVILFGCIAVFLFIVALVYDDSKVWITERRKRQYEMQHRHFHEHPIMAPPFTIVEPEREVVDWEENRWLETPTTPRSAG